MAKRCSWVHADLMTAQLEMSENSWLSPWLPAEYSSKTWRGCCCPPPEMRARSRDRRCPIDSSYCVIISPLSPFYIRVWGRGVTSSAIFGTSGSSVRFFREGMNEDVVLSSISRRETHRVSHNATLRVSVWNGHLRLIWRVRAFSRVFTKHLGDIKSNVTVVICS